MKRDQAPEADFTDRLLYALKLRGMNRHQLQLELKAWNERTVQEGGNRLPNVSPRDVYAFASHTRRKIPPLPTLAAISRILGVRRSWLAFGDGKVEFGIPGDDRRELYLIDGEAEGEKGGTAVEPEERARIRDAFNAGLLRAGGAIGLRRASTAVQAAFASLYEGHLARCRKAGHKGPADPAWRGAEAARLWRELLRGASRGPAVGGSLTEALLRTLPAALPPDQGC